MNRPIFDWGEEFEDFLRSLNVKDEAKMRALIARVEATDLQDSIRKERVKKLSKNIYELRSQTNEHWLRGCYFQIQGNSYWITHGFSKKSNRTPKREITRAETIRTTYFRRKTDE